MILQEDTFGMSASPAHIADQTVESSTPIPLEVSKSAPANPPENRTWWKEASVYQIYPSSFKDSNNDGIGDIPGITSKVDYIHSLGVDVVWLSPIYKSPGVDMGYDISDYEDIDPQYGTLEDVQVLINEVHSKGMKFVMDLVVNHSSDQHEWFKQSRSSKDSPYRSWYHWHPGKIVDGKREPPNNWGSYFSGSAWTWDEATQEYYLHIFAKEQPDLNWENPDVVKAVHKVIRFWLDRGVDGFRMDVINFISKEPGYPDATVSSFDSHIKYHNGSEHFANGPRLHEYLQDIGAILKEYNAFSVGEMPCVKDANEILKVVGFDRNELNMIFHFEIVDLDHGAGGKFSDRDFSIRDLKDVTNKWQTFMYQNSGWNALYLENHDQSRTVSRYCSDLPQHRIQAAKMLATFLGFQAGTPFIYQGQELGMINVPKEWDLEQYRDLETLNHWKEVEEHYKDQPEALKAYKVEYQKKGRDNARTPMQWENKPNAGFTDAGVKPWINANPSYEYINAASQVDDPDSPFTYWKQVLQKRKEYVDLFVYGDFELVKELVEDKNVVAYRRMYKNQEALVVCNWSSNTIARTEKVLGLDGQRWQIILRVSESLNISNSGTEMVIIPPWEAFVIVNYV